MIGKLFGKVLGFFGGNVRLYIEYAMIALILALAGLSWYGVQARKNLSKSVVKLSTDLGSVSERLKSQVATNHAQDKAIATLKKLRKIDNQSIIGLQSLLSHTDKKQEAKRTSIKRAEKKHAAVERFLDQSVPVDVSCVLDSAPCPADGHDKDSH